MLINQLHVRHDARPFRPFTLRLNDGRKAVVDHPELMIIPPDTDALVFVYEVPGGLRIIDVPSINEISFASPKNGKAKPKPKRR
jgi:hypothetical protein